MQEKFEGQFPNVKYDIEKEKEERQQRTNERPQYDPIANKERIDNLFEEGIDKMMSTTSDIANEVEALKTRKIIELDNRYRELSEKFGKFAKEFNIRIKFLQEQLRNPLHELNTNTKSAKLLELKLNSLDKELERLEKTLEEVDIETINSNAHQTYRDKVIAEVFFQKDDKGSKAQKIFSELQSYRAKIKELNEALKPINEKLAPMLQAENYFVNPKTEDLKTNLKENERKTFLN